MSDGIRAEKGHEDVSIEIRNNMRIIRLLYAREQEHIQHDDLRDKCVQAYIARIISLRMAHIEYVRRLTKQEGLV
jgi:DNA-binding winged helix-turn-helix (wHTH) protein